MLDCSNVEVVTDPRLTFLQAEEGKVHRTRLNVSMFHLRLVR